MSGITAVFYRDYRQRMTNIGFVFWDLFVPLAYLLLFGLGFERMLGGTVPIAGASFGYIEFLLPGVLGMVVGAATAPLPYSTSTTKMLSVFSRPSSTYWPLATW